MSSEPIGIIAGEPPLPLLTVRAVRSQGKKSVVAGIRGSCPREVGREADAFQAFALTQVGRAIRFLKTHGVRQAVMVGRVRHPAIFSLLAADPHFFRLLGRMRDRTTTSLLSTVADFFRGQGIELLDSTLFLQPLLVRPIHYTPRLAISSGLADDIAFGWSKAWGIAGLDIGQTVCVKQRSVVAAEAMEGTDAVIERAGAIAGRGVVVVKVSRPGADMRFDVPVVGRTTMERLAAIRAAALVLEAGRTLLLDEAEAVRLAARWRIRLLGKI